MGFNIRNNRFVRIDKKLKSRLRRTLLSNNDCPSITLGNNISPNAFIFVGNSDSGLASLITGGSPTYTIGTTTGTVPTGMTLAVAELLGDYYVTLTGEATTFGSFTFTATVLDNNGCESTPKEFTIEVWAEFTFAGPEDILPGLSTYILPVSGITSPIVSGEIVSMEVNLSIDDLTILTVEAQNPDFNVVTHYSQGDLVGTNFTGTIFGQDSDPAINTGSNPYTGTWKTSDAGNTWSGMDGDTANGDWVLSINNQGAATGSLSSFKLTFRP